jgi:hypothetical protein
MTRIVDDFDAIRARLAELRGETPRGGAREFNEDELIIISDVSVPLSSLRIGAELDADAYKRGAEGVATFNRRIEESNFGRALRKFNEAVAKASIASVRHSELMALMEERFAGVPMPFTTDDIQPGDELVTDFEQVGERCYWLRTIKLIRNGEVVGISRTHSKPIDLNMPAR